jgi:argininosuccinate lyase
MPGFTHLKNAQAISFAHYLNGLCRDVLAEIKKDLLII